MYVTSVSHCPRLFELMGVVYREQLSIVVDGLLIRRLFLTPSVKMTPRITLEIQQGNQLFDALGLTKVRRKDARCESLAFFRGPVTIECVGIRPFRTT